MRILVTGNLGYVGSHLTEILIDSGHEVIGCDLSLFPNAICRNLVIPTKQLIRDYRALKLSDLIGVDAIAHLAGLSNDPMGNLNPGLTLEINGFGTVNLAKLAKLAKVKSFIFASSCALYGNSGSKPRTEKDETNPLSEYATSKLLAEQGIKALATDDFHVYILRNATAYGASSVFRTDLVANDLSAGMCAAGVAQIRSDGSPWRPLIHCRDMARAFQMFLEKDPQAVSGKPINIGFETENFQVKEIGAEIQKTWPSGEIEYSLEAASDPRDYKVDFSLLNATFPSFKPNWPLRVGISELRDFLLSIRYSIADRNSKRYVRIHELKNRINELI